MKFRIVNNQLSSAGNDFLIDDIAIYMKKPEVEGNLRTAMCGGEAVVKFSLDYFQLLDITGMSDATEAQTVPIGFCIIDSLNYHNYMNGMDKDGKTV